MEYIKGSPLLTHVADAGLDSRARLEIFVLICDAVQHAHQRGVVHRDLKPANILVDARGTPRILDFGVARFVGDSLESTMVRTEAGQVLGTVPYMSPEQIAGDPAAIDARCDVYALGLIGFELLANQLPYPVRDRPLADAARIIREEEPTRLVSMSRSFRGDLDTIFAKALEKAPSRRYASVSELGADVRRYLANEPIDARRPSAMYQLAKFTRRNRGLVTSAADGLRSSDCGDHRQPGPAGPSGCRRRRCVGRRRRSAARSRPGAPDR